MKRFLCGILAVILCMVVAVPVFAAENDFVPSISYKDHPELVPGKDENGKDYIGIIRDPDGNIIDYVYADCIVITSIAAALDRSTRIPEDARELLLAVYEAILDGSMTLPYKNPEGMVIRDLLDVTFLCGEHPDMLEPAGVTLELTFDLGIGADVDVTVMTYKFEQWGEIVSVTNNGDGTVTCVFEHLCPVSFSVSQRDIEVEPPYTGDEMGGHLWVWILVMVASGASLVVLTENRRKFNG